MSSTYNHNKGVKTRVIKTFFIDRYIRMYQLRGESVLEAIGLNSAQIAVIRGAAENG